MIINYNENKYHVSEKNKKLVPNKKTAFLIWNLPSKITCPYATEMCKKACYAVKAEKQYKKYCLPARHDNLKASRSETFIPDMVRIISEKAHSTRKPELIVRIHESGDFYNKVYAMAWIEIAKQCLNIEKVKFIAYTKSFPYFDGIDLPSNFSLRASIWADTKPEQIAIILRNQWPIYTAVESFTVNDTFTQCRCADCATCGKCWDKTVPDIRCEIH